MHDPDQFHRLTESELREIEEFDANTTARRGGDFERVDGPRTELGSYRHVNHRWKFDTSDVSE